LDGLTDKQVSPMTTKLAYSVPEFAKANTVSESLIWREIGDGELETLLVGDRRLITPEQGARWHERKAEQARQRRAERTARQLEPAE
jgi:hypothetical protein